MHDFARKPKMSAGVMTLAVIFYGACLVFVGLFILVAAMLVHSFVDAIPTQTLFACVIGVGMIAGTLILFKTLADMRDKNMRFYHEMHTLLDDTDPSSRAVSDDEQEIIDSLNALMAAPSYSKNLTDPRD